MTSALPNFGIYGGSGSGGGGSAPSGTGLAKVVAGAFVSPASLLVNADVSAIAAIDGTKISPAFGAQLITTDVGLAIGATPAVASAIRIPHNSQMAGRDNANANDRAIIGWGTNGNDEVVVGNVTTRTQILGNPIATQVLTNGTIPATAGDFRVKHNWQLNGRNNANSANANLLNWGTTTTDTLTLGDASFANAINGTSTTLNAPVVNLSQGLGGTLPGTGNFRIPSTISWTMVARNNSNTANCNIIRSNNTANGLVFGDTAWGNVTVQGPSLSLVTGGTSVSLGTTGINITAVNALQSQFFWSTASVTPVISQIQAATATAGNSLTVRSQAGGTSGNQNGGDLILEAGAGTGSGVRGTVQIIGGGLTFTTPAAAAATAGAGALPAAPQEFMTITFNGNVRKIPLYLN